MRRSSASRRRSVISSCSAANDALADLAALGVPAEAAADFTRLRDRVDSFDYDEAQVIVAAHRRATREDDFAMRS